MSKDQVIGVGVLVASLLGLGVYFYLLFFSSWIILMVQLTAFVAVAAVLVILARKIMEETIIKGLKVGLDGVV
jgi:Zn-dependent protease with chaperone function